MFFSEDIPNIKDYLIYDLLIPSFKQVFVDTLQNTIDLVFWGKVRGRAGSKSNNGTYVSYNSFSRPQLTSSNRRLDYDFTELEFETRDDAENVLEVLRDIVDRYGKVKVADLYDACGVTGNGYTDEDYGWRDLRDARVVRTRTGFIFDMPRPIQFR